MLVRSIRWFLGGTRARTDASASVPSRTTAPVTDREPGSANEDAARVLVGASTSRTPVSTERNGTGPLAVRLGQAAAVSPTFDAPIGVGDRVLVQRGSKSFEVARVLEIDEARGVYYVERKPIYESDAAVLHVSRAALRAAVPDDESPFRKGDVVAWRSGNRVASIVDAVYEGGLVLREGATFAHPPRELIGFSTRMTTMAGSEVKVGDVVSWRAGLARFLGVSADGIAHLDKLSENGLLPEVGPSRGLELEVSPREVGAVVQGLEGTPYATGIKIEGGVIRNVYDNGTLALDVLNRAMAGPPRLETTVRSDEDLRAYLARHAQRRTEARGGV